VQLNRNPVKEFRAEMLMSRRAILMTGSDRNVSVDVCICTFRRASVLATLDSITRQRLTPAINLRMIVADNDALPTMREAIKAFAASCSDVVKYYHVPAGNISLARNACLENADADYIAFIDDDEVADPDWLHNLITRAEEADADVVFGPAFAVYPTSAPGWMRENDFHSNWPGRRAGIVETGYSSNALIRWRGRPFTQERFRLSLGRTGGEDVEFFFRLHRMSARLDIAPDAIVREPVQPNRLTLSWLIVRRFTFGRIYGAFAAEESSGRRVRLFGSAAAKALYCALRTLPALASRRATAFWALRAVFHAGVCAGCLREPRQEFYGKMCQGQAA
jgi:succinoglycan biosynthesis protein ExoM